MSGTGFRAVLHRALADKLYDHVHPHGCGLEQAAADDVLAVLDRYLRGWDAPRQSTDDGHAGSARGRHG